MYLTEQNKKTLSRAVEFSKTAHLPIFLYHDYDGAFVVRDSMPIKNNLKALKVWKGAVYFVENTVIGYSFGLIPCTIHLKRAGGES